MNDHAAPFKSSNTFVPNIPPASNLVLLSELPRIAPGTKVRFLGCVNSYDASSATVTLITKYPSHTSTKAKGSDLSVQARLDVSLVLPPITPKELFEVGTWLTVIGYVAYAKPGSSRTRQMSNSVEVQVLMLLSSGEGTKSGGMQDERYIRAVEARRKGMRVMEKAREAYGSC